MFWSEANAGTQLFINRDRLSCMVYSYCEILSSYEKRIVKFKGTLPVS